MTPPTTLRYRISQQPGQPVFYCPTCNRHMHLKDVEWDTWRGPGPSHRVVSAGLKPDHFHTVCKVQQIDPDDAQQFFFLRHLDQDVRAMDRLAAIKRRGGPASDMIVEGHKPATLIVP